MSDNPFVPNNDLSKLQRSATNYLEDSTKNITDTTKDIAKQSTEALKGLAGKLTEQNRAKAASKNNSGNRIGKKLARGLGDKARSGFGKVGKLKHLTKLRKASSINAGVKAGRAIAIAKRGRTALKLAQVGKVALTGGAALAGGPVGIALFAGSILAPMAIEAIWKNREKIYDKGNSIYSKLTEEDMVNITEAKQKEVGATVEGAKNIRIESSDKQTLLETDANGTIVENNFPEQSKLAYYQQESGKPSMVMDEEDWQEIQGEMDAVDRLEPSSVTSKATNIAYSAPPDPKAEPNTIENSPPKETAEEIAGVEVVRDTLNELTANNSNNPEIRNSANLLKDTLDVSQENSYRVESPVATAEPKVKFNRNSAGSNLIDLFDREGDGECLTTKDYEIQRRGRSYFLKDTQGNVLMEARKTMVGTKIQQENLNPRQKQELNFLSEDLQEGKGITGGFKPVARAIGSAIAATPGATMIRFMDENIRSLSKGGGLKTAKYNLDKVDGVYQLSDTEGNLLFSAKKNDRGQIVTKGKLSDGLKQDFSQLQSEIDGGNAIGGAFKLVGKALEKTLAASPGGALIGLFKQHSRDGENLQTADYKINRKGNVYFLRDPENKLVMMASQNEAGVQTKMTDSAKLKNDLKFLSQDLQNDMGITGSFKPIETANEIVPTRGLGSTKDKEPSLINRFEKLEPNNDLPQATPQAKQIER